MTESLKKLREYWEAAFPQSDMTCFPEQNDRAEVNVFVFESIESLIKYSEKESKNFLLITLDAISKPNFRSYNDEEVNNANRQVVALIAGKIPNFFEKEAGKGYDHVSCIFDKLLSQLFPDERDVERDYATMEECVLKFLPKCSEAHRRAILTKLLEKCRGKYLAVGGGKIVDLPHTKFLQKTFNSLKCLQTLGSLLESDLPVIEKENYLETNQDNLSRTSEVESLLALSPLPDISRETMTLQKSKLMEILLQQNPKANLSDNPPSFSLADKSVVPILGDLLKHLLTSKDKKLCRSAIEWMVGVLERNKIRGLADPLSKEYEKTNCDGQMVNFCQILLWIAQDNFKVKEQCIKTSYSTYLERLKQLGQDILRGNTEQENEDWNVELALFILCQQAISVCLLPAIERMQCFFQVLAGRRGKITDDPEAGVAMLAWYDEVIWGQDLCDLVRKFAELQLEILHSRIQDVDTTEDNLFPDEYVCSIASWYASYIGRRHPALEAKTLNQFTEVCKFYLQFPNPNPRIAAHLVFALITFDDREITSKMDQTVLVQCYINLSTMFRNPSRRGVFQLQLARCDFVVLLLREFDDPKSLAVMKSRDFIEAVLETVVCLMASFLCSHVPKAQNERVCSGSRTEGELWHQENDQITKPNEKDYLHAVGMHLVLLDILTFHYSSSEIFPSHSAASAFCWIVNNFFGYKSPKSCRGLHKTLIARSIKCFLNILCRAADVQEGFKEALKNQEDLEIRKLGQAWRLVRSGFTDSEEVDEMERLIMDRKLAYSKTQQSPEVRLTLEEEDQTALNEDALLDSIQDAFTDCQVSRADLLSTHSFRHVLKDYSATSAKTKELLEDQFNEFVLSLPHDLDGVKFLVRDQTRDDVLQCLISGPMGTPYSRGLFIFDIYCPPEYPEEPPLVKFLNTGGGTALFNPRLQRDGNICLSILGTSLAEDESGKWHETDHSFLDILREIFILMMNDANDSSRIGEIRELTVRHAMLRNWPKSVEPFAHQHFALSRKPLLQQLVRWADEKDKYLDKKRFQSVRHNIKLFVQQLNEIARNETITHQ